jgi:hypothetical protein
MPTDRNDPKPARSKSAALLYFAALVLVAQKLYPLIVQRGEFMNLPRDEALRWLVSLPSLMIFACIAAVVFALNLRSLQRLNFIGLLLSSVIVAVVGSELLFPYDLLHTYELSLGGLPVEWILFLLLSLSALFAPRALAKWLVGKKKRNEKNKGSE